MPEELGTGSFGVTWKAYDRVQKLPVAIKIFYFGGEYITRPDGMHDVLKQADGECKLMQAMVAEESSYPEGKAHICRCLESHALDQEGDEDVAFIVLEYCGVSLQKKLDENTEQPSPDFISKARHWMKGCLMAIQFMSGLETPLQHGDITADNIVVDDSNEAKFIDFGWTRPSDAPTPYQWATDVYGLVFMYGKLLCDSTAFKFHPPSCHDGSLGLGTLQDWELVRMVDEEMENASPEALIKLLR